MTKNIQVGDIVHVRGTVTDTNYSHAIGVRIAKTGYHFHPESIVHVEPRPIKVGDRVRLSGDRPNGTVMAIDGRSVWVRIASGHHETWTLDYLTRIDGEPS